VSSQSAETSKTPNTHFTCNNKDTRRQTLAWAYLSFRYFHSFLLASALLTWWWKEKLFTQEFFLSCRRKIRRLRWCWWKQRSSLWRRSENFLLNPQFTWLHFATKQKPNWSKIRKPFNITFYLVPRKKLTPEHNIYLAGETKVPNFPFQVYFPNNTKYRL